MFRLDLRLATDTYPVSFLELCEVRLKRGTLNNPWLILVPQRTDLVEMHDLAEAERHLLIDEIARTGEALKSVTDCDKINVAAFGNMVAQMHVHIISRFVSDPWWPGPIDMAAEGRDWDRSALDRFRDTLATAL